MNEHFDPKRFSEEQDTFPPGGAISFGMQYITEKLKRSSKATSKTKKLRECYLKRIKQQGCDMENYFINYLLSFAAFLPFYRLRAHYLQIIFSHCVIPS